MRIQNDGNGDFLFIVGGGEEENGSIGSVRDGAISRRRRRLFFRTHHLLLRLRTLYARYKWRGSSYVLLKYSDTYCLSSGRRSSAAD